MRDAILLSPLPCTDDAFASRQRRLAAIEAAHAADVASERPNGPVWPTDFSGGWAGRFDPNKGARRTVEAPRPEPVYGVTVAQLVGDGDPSPGALEGLRRAALAGAMDGRLGGVRRATGRSSEHVGPRWTEDEEAAADAVQSTYAECMEAYADGMRYGIPGRIVERDGATWQRVRRPAQHARQLAKRFGQRRSRDRIRMRDAIGERPTDYVVPQWAKEMDEAKLVAGVPAARRHAFERLVNGRDVNRTRDLRRIADHCTPDQCAALVAVAMRSPEGAPRLG